MTQRRLFLVLKLIIVMGILLIITGHILLTSGAFKETMGIYSYMISAACIALGLIMSLPTKMYLTILLMRREGHKSQL